MKIFLRISALLIALFGASPAFAQCGSSLPGGTVCGNRTGSTGLNGPLTNPVLGIPGMSLGQLGLAGSSSGTATIKPQAASGSPTLTLPNLSGTIPSTSVSPITLDSASGAIGCATCLTGGGGALIATAPLNLTGSTLSLQGATGTVATGSSGTGSAFSATPTLGVAGTTLGTLTLSGNTSGTVRLTPQAAAGTGTTLTLPNTSGTVADGASSPLVLSTTTGNLTCPTCVTSSGGGAITGTAPINVSAAAVVSCPTCATSTLNGAALTAANDTNVTLTLGGTPATSLLNAASITAGWTGTLALSRGGLGASQAAATANQIPIYPGGGGAAVPSLASNSSLAQMPAGTLKCNYTTSAANPKDCIQVIYNVVDFGATGNGITDDSAAIQVAFNAANGNAVYFPSGTYNLGTTVITMPANNVQMLMSPTAHFSGTGHLPTFLGNASEPISGAYFAAFPNASDVNFVNVLGAEFWAGNTYTGPGGQALMVTAVTPSISNAHTFWGANFNCIVQNGFSGGQCVAAEIDVNNFSATPGLGIGFNFTGTGTSKPLRAIMVDRSGGPNWEEAINVANADLPWHSIVSTSGNTIQQRLGAAFNSNSDTQSISFFAGGDATEFGRIAQGLDGTGTKGTLTFSTYNGSTLTQALKLDQDGNASATGRLGSAQTIVTSACPYTILNAGGSFEFTGTCTVTLPSATTYAGQWIYIKNAGGAFAITSASSNVEPQAGGAAGTAILSATSGKWAALQANSNGTWIIMMSN